MNKSQRYLVAGIATLAVAFWIGTQQFAAFLAVIGVGAVILAITEITFE